MTDKKPKLLWVADFAAMTGFGRVSGAILPRLKDNFEIVATTFPNFYTWGENMYVEITEIENNMSEIKFTSATIFGYSWKRNKKNTDKFFQLFEESLTI